LRRNVFRWWQWGQTTSVDMVSRTATAGKAPTGTWDL
jgi:hypothetical protein